MVSHDVMSGPAEAREASADASNILDLRRPFLSVAWVVVGAIAVFAAWRFRTKAVQDILLAGGLVYAIYRARCRFFAAWWNPAGVLALTFLVMVGVLAPFGVDPDTSTSLLVKYLDFVAAGLALPVLLCTRRRRIRFIFCCALAITALIVWDLTRLFVLYGVDVVTYARGDPNPVLIHPNIVSSVAAVAAILAGVTALSQRRSKVLFALALLIAALNVLYILLVRSRGAQLALFLAVGFTAVVAARSWRAYAGIAVAAIGCVVAIGVANPRFTSFGMLDRDVVWRHTAALVSERPCVGYGVGEQVFMAAYHESEPPESRHHFHHPHMYWLNELFRFGWPATIVEAGMWLMLAIRLGRRVAREACAGGAGAPAGVFALVVFVQVMGVFDCTPNILGLTALLCVPLGLAVSRNRETVCHG